MKEILQKTCTAAAVLVMTASLFTGSAPGETPSEMRDSAQRHYNDGNYVLALELYEELLLNAADGDIATGTLFDRAFNCLRSLNRWSETDGLRERALAAHPRNWRLLWRVAESLFSDVHYGYIVAGEFSRGDHRGGGRYVGSFERDRAQALGIMERARNLTAGEPVAVAVAEFHLRFAEMIMGYRGLGGAWRLQYLTDFKELPDYEDGYGYHRGGDARYAPAGPGGDPVFHYLPASWEEAASDGERWRWLLSQAASVDEYQAERVAFLLADFHYQQFGVQTMASYGRWFGRGSETEEEGSESGTYALQTLSEGETIARLASGVRRFDLPREFNFILAFREIDRRAGSYGENSLNRLAQIYEKRRQYRRAADTWRQSIEKYGGGGGWKEERLHQIVGSWGQFEPLPAQPAGKGATLEFRFRNGRKAAFEAHRIRVGSLLDDIKG